jgi:hypothetical protein
MKGEKRPIFAKRGDGVRSSRLSDDQATALRRMLATGEGRILPGCSACADVVPGGACKVCGARFEAAAVVDLDRSDA